MKKLMIAILACALFVSLCACGKAQQETPTATTAATSVTAPTTADDPTDATQLTPFELAREYTGRSVSELYDLIGYPNSSDYAPSCMGEGEDGNLYYDGFIVYTYREGDTETIHFVE
ncbi:MAG: hypothetical protein IJ403_04865 [Oscillospiraceae bacterium]|nr:hypothetical protein [Oscillospiraceae bacterium]